MHACGGQFTDVRVVQRGGAGQFVLEDIADDGLHGGAILAFIRVKAGEDRRVLIERELCAAFLVGNTAVERTDAGGIAVCRAVCLEKIKHAG